MLYNILLLSKEPEKNWKNLMINYVYSDGL
jgi:hypothetical protein